jgi:hypothetical protein
VKMNNREEMQIKLEEPRSERRADVKEIWKGGLEGALYGLSR